MSLDTSGDVMGVIVGGDFIEVVVGGCPLTSGVKARSGDLIPA